MNAPTRSRLGLLDLHLGLFQGEPLEALETGTSFMLAGALTALFPAILSGETEQQKFKKERNLCENKLNVSCSHAQLSTVKQKLHQDPFCS